MTTQAPIIAIEFKWSFNNPETNTACSLSAVTTNESRARLIITEHLDRLQNAYIATINTPDEKKFACARSLEAFEDQETSIRCKLRNIFAIALRVGVHTIMRKQIVVPSNNIGALANCLMLAVAPQQTQTKLSSIGNVVIG